MESGCGRCRDRRSSEGDRRANGLRLGPPALPWTWLSVQSPAGHLYPPAWLSKGAAAARRGGKPHTDPWTKDGMAWVRSGHPSGSLNMGITMTDPPHDPTGLPTPLQQTRGQCGAEGRVGHRAPRSEAPGSANQRQAVEQGLSTPQAEEPGGAWMWPVPPPWVAPRTAALWGRRGQCTPQPLP